MIALALYLCRVFWGKFQGCDDYEDARGMYVCGMAIALMVIVWMSVQAVMSIGNLLTADYRTYEVLKELFTK